jgi:hypothetical protein
MTGYNIANLADMVSAIGEERTKNLLSNFCCPLNKDVEAFLHTKAIDFSKQGLASTHLVFESYKERPVLVGYFSLANKLIRVPRKDITSNQWRRRISKFATNRREYDEEQHDYLISAPLIGQLGKNFVDGYNQLIKGDILLKLALDKVAETQRIMGGRFVYLECEDKPSLIKFYVGNGFVSFGKRDLERDERDTQSGNYLVQMLKYMH